MSSDMQGRGKSRRNFAGQARHVVPKSPAPFTCDTRDWAAAVRAALEECGVRGSCATALVVATTRVRVTIEGFVADRHFSHVENFSAADGYAPAVAWTRIVMTTREAA